MKIRSAEAEWQGNLTAGKGHVRTESGVLDADYDFSGRFEEGAGTNPEELIAAAHAGCFSMALAHGLTSAGHAPTSIRTTAKVKVEKKEGAFVISLIELETEGTVPGLDEATFRAQAETAKANCPVSKALAGPEIRLSKVQFTAG